MDMVIIMTEILKKLISIPSVSGRESTITEFIRSEIEALTDSVYTDKLGNLIALKKGYLPNPKKIMLAAHIDEIGFIVTHIDDKGFIRVAPIGGINWAAIAYTLIKFENGQPGLIVPESQTAPAEYKAEKFVVDIGATTKKEAEKKIKIGDTAIFEPKLTRLMKSMYAGHAIDDKIGAAVMIEMLKTKPSCPHNVYFVFSVQEEVGCRGSKTAAYAIAPDYSLAFDVTGTGDTVNALPMAVSLGSGAAIKIKDSSVISDPNFVKLLADIATENKIPFQYEILTAGGTDTSSMQSAGAGSIACCLSIPTRYIHSGVETFDRRDADACVKLATLFITRESI